MTTAVAMASAGVRGLPARIEDWLESETSQLPLWIPIALGLGIVAYFILPWAAQRTAVGIFMLAVIGLGCLSRGATARVLVWGGALVVLGLAVAQWRTDDVAAAVLRDRYEGDVAGVVDAVEIRSGRGQVRFTVVPDNPGLPRLVRISLKSGVPAGLAPGARITVRAALSPPAGPGYPGGYDFARRAWFSGLVATGYPLGTVVVTADAPPPTGLAARFANLRVRLTARLQAAVPGPAGAISAAFVTGDQGGIPEDVAQAMRYAGLAHILSISGVHIAIVVGGAMWLTRAALTLSLWIALRWPIKAISAATAAFAGVFYTMLAGGEVPTVRSCIATVVVLLGIVVGREALSLRLIAAGAFLILLFRPEALLGPSFQLSFAAVTGLVSLYQSRAGRWLSSAGGESRLARLGRHFLALVCTGIVAEAMLSATALFHFNQTGTYGVVANLIAILWTSFVIMPLLLLALLLDTVGIGGSVYWLLGKSMDLLIRLATDVAAWPGSVARLALMPTLAYALLVGGGLWLWLCLWRGNARWLGVVPIVLGAGLALRAQPPDLLVSADGHHVALLIGTDAAEGARLALLRERAGDYIRDMWGGATAATADAAIAGPMPTAASTLVSPESERANLGYHCLERPRRPRATSGNLAAKAGYCWQRCRRTASLGRRSPRRARRPTSSSAIGDCLTGVYRAGSSLTALHSGKAARSRSGSKPTGSPPSPLRLATIRGCRSRRSGGPTRAVSLHPPPSATTMRSLLHQA